MDLIHLPYEIIDMIIFKCDLSALLQLRLVSKSFKKLVNMSRHFPDVLEKVSIRLDCSTIIEFANSAPCLPFSSFIFHHTPIRTGKPGGDSAMFYDNPSFQTIIDSFCPHIRKLQVHTMSCCVSDGEYEFYQALENLTELEINELRLQKTEGTKSKKTSTSNQQTRLPFHEKNLKIKRLAVNTEFHCGDYLIDLIKLCPSLEVLKMTGSKGNTYVGRKMFEEAPLIKDKNMCYPYIMRLGSEGHLKNLKQLDCNLKAIKMDLCSPEDAQFFQTIVLNTEFWFENVSASLCCEIESSTVPTDAKDAFEQRVDKHLMQMYFLGSKSRLC